MHSHKQILDRLGRTKDVAAELGITTQRVSNWKRDGRGIPHAYRPTIKALADFKVPADFLRPTR